MGFHASRRFGLSMLAGLVVLATGCGGTSHGGADAPTPGSPPTAPVAQPLAFGVHPMAAVVLGQSSFETMGAGPALDQLSFPMASAVTGDGRLIVVDARNDVLKTYSSYDAIATGRAADFETNVGDHVISTAGPRVVSAVGPSMRIYNQWPSAQGPLQPDQALSGAAGCGPNGLLDVAAARVTPMGRLVVADRSNHRVLIWNSVPGSDPLGPADIVIGQPDMDSCNENASPDADTRGPTARGVLSRPADVWSDDTLLIVSDFGNHRVLVWDTFPRSSQEPDHVIGQADFVSSEPNAGAGPRAHTLNAPRSVDVNEHGQLAVADAENNRVLIWNSIPRTDGKAADQVVGQPTFEDGASGPAPDARSVFLPYQARFHKRNLIVSEPERNRVVIWRSQD